MLQPGGFAAYTQNGTTTNTLIPTADAAAFFGYLKADAPVSSLPTTTCPKSASFGTATTIVYAGSTSGDVSCPAQNADGSPNATTENVLTATRQVENDARPAPSPAATATATATASTAASAT